MADINDLLIRIDATTETLRREMRRAETTVDQGGRRIDSRLQRIDRSFQRMGRAAATARNAVAAVFAALAVRRAARFIQSTVQTTAAISELADNANIGAEQLQELQYAFGQLAGVTDRETAEAFRRFNRRLGLATQGTGAAVKAVDQLGLSFADANGFMRDTDEVLDEALQKLAGVENGAQRAALASQLFGEDAGPKLAAALGQGAAAVDDMRRAAREMGVVLSQEAVDDARALNDEMAAISRTLSAELARTVMDNADSIRSLAEAIGSASAAVVRGLGHVTEFTRWIGEELAAAIHGVASDDIPRLERELDRLLEIQGRLSQMPEGARILGMTQADIDSQIESLRELLRLAYDTPPPSRPGRERERAQVLAPTSEEGDELDRELEQRRRAAERLLSSTRTQVERLRVELDEARSLAAEGLFGDDADRVLGRIKESLSEAEREASGFNAAMAETRGFFDQTRTAAERLEARIARVQELADEGFFARSGIDDQEILDRLNQQLEELDNTLEQATESSSRAAVDMGFAFESAFERAVIEGGKLRDVLQGLAQDIARIALRTAITAPLGQAIGSGLGNILPFARGGVVDRPTFFPMSGNRTGVAGEAGPEGILPLKRMPGGDLGVQADGGRSTTVNIHIDAPGADQRTLELVREVARQEIVPQAIKGAMSATVNVLHRPAFS